MTVAFFPVLRGLQPRRRLPGSACLLGALALAILAGCNSGGCGGMGGGSGYQVDGLPGLLSCSSTTSSTNAAGTTTDVTMPTMIAQNTGFNNNEFDPSGPVFYPMTMMATTFPATGTTPVLAFPAGSVSVPNNPTNPNDYTLTMSPLTAGYTLECEIGGTTNQVFVATAPYAVITGSSATLQVNFPMFTNTGKFTIDCIGVNASGSTTALASLTVNVP